ncbi:sulfite exporter TauE/SafE family protein [Marinomonas transparens]|uniref:Probable membrane transporter protein n=1 Tax=Marinomonas transparens TaxID=2795388 RepID=A0A934N6N4_9GAMM|nr:sulfite exporter TauE/SafE family protein [Marinomonas transparens]MBJ7538211.1 sulfite exporter TauE/SafE family protein [Marinomonas transparens]
MMQAEWFLLLMLLGAGSGAVNGVIGFCSMLIVVPVLYFFAPFFEFDFSNMLLPIVATCIAAFTPTYLYQWVRAMKEGKVAFQKLIDFAPGVAMGGIIGAQLMSLINWPVFFVCFSIVSLMACFNFVLQIIKPEQRQVASPLARLPIGLSIGALSLLSANSGKTLSESLFFAQPCPVEQRQATATGLAVFASIAAVVGFAFPAVAFDKLNLSGFAGAIHLPSFVVLSLSHFVFYWLCQSKGNTLDKGVLTVSLIVFLIVSLLRIGFF